MQITFFGHACVRIADGSSAVVIDPGNFTDAAQACAGVDAILVTHVHRDHVDPEQVVSVVSAQSTTAVYCEADSYRVLLGAGLEPTRATVVAPGDRFTIGSLAVDVGGGWHAVVHRDLPRAINVTYTVSDGTTAVYHRSSEPTQTCLSTLMSDSCFVEVA